MAKTPFTKPFITYAAQLQQLKDRGLEIEDEGKAAHLLEVISYYRLSGYWLPMLAAPKSNHIFKAGSSFNKAFNLYCFDRELRHQVYGQLEKVEVAVRAKMIYLLSEVHGPFWYSNADLYKNAGKLAKCVDKLEDETQRSDEQFIKAFKHKYSDPLPPCWMILEISSFGNLSHIYRNLRPGAQKRAIANHFGLDETTFESWIHTIVYVRNICAHHTRFWNRVMSITPAVPISPGNTWLQTLMITNPDGTTRPINNRTYFFLSLLVYFLNTINPRHTFKEKVKNLLGKYDNVDPRAMGAPPGWEEEDLWK